MKSSAKFLARSALAAALGVAVLYLYTIIPWGKLAWICVASIFVILIRMTCDLRWAIGCYAATALLGLLILPVKAPALLYAAFFGYYPLVKLALERLQKPAARWGLKFVLCNIVFGITFLVARELLFSVPVTGGLGVILVFLVVNVVFFVYDYALTQIILLYLRKIHGRIQ